MNTVSVTKVIEIRYIITGFKNYGFGIDKKLYNLKTSREIKKTLNCRSIGYWIGRNFYSLNKLKPLLIRPKQFNTPF